MSGTVFTKVDYNLGSLVKDIELGNIGLPDIQRPFVWKNAKVRDLFDSMYRGYPVGYLLMWRNGLSSDRAIGTDAKQKPPSLVIVDGQQRLTSLYAVVKGVPVVRDNYDSEQIRIAFNPLEERFEVHDVAIQRDVSFIPNISCIWSNGTNIFKVAKKYLEGLQAIREVTEDEIERVQNAITKLQALLTFPFTALELATDISEGRCLRRLRPHQQQGNTAQPSRFHPDSDVGLLGPRPGRSGTLLSGGKETDQGDGLAVQLLYRAGPGPDAACGRGRGLQARPIAVRLFHPAR